MAFREKLAWALLATTVGGYAVYLLMLRSVTSSAGWDAPVEALVPALIGMTILMIVLAIVGAIVATVSAPQEAGASDERDLAIRRIGRSRAYGVMISGVCGIIILAVSGSNMFQAANALVSILAIAEIVRYGSEAWNYRRGY
ncbi:hypothetical protein [Stakelama marina]|uniref:hypothetical protein n=1 Tax=Stakelama marina TaxID=2826939 RepID=UPI0024C33736|nr:hypothetical protein [Stakelama marina]